LYIRAELTRSNSTHIYYAIVSKLSDMNASRQVITITLQMSLLEMQQWHPLLQDYLNLNIVVVAVTVVVVLVVYVLVVEAEVFAVPVAAAAEYAG
jgi:hypothetical protein